MRLTVHNFACLKFIDIEFKKYTIFIGEQASGKSVTCKLYYFYRECISNNMRSSILDDEGWQFFVNKTKEDFHSIFPEYSWKSMDFEILFGKNNSTFDLKITYKRGNKWISTEFSEAFKEKFKKIKLRYNKMKKEADSSNKNMEEFFLRKDYDNVQFFRKAYTDLNLDDLLEGVTYIPSGRAFFSVIRDNVFGFLSENIGIDPFLKSFGKFFEFSKRVNHTHDLRINKKLDLTSFDKLSASVLKGHYQFEKKEDWLVSSGSRIQLTNASSGQQEALPMLLCLRSLLLSKSAIGGRSVVVEEPEAHLFPTSQKTVVELIFLSSMMATDTKFIITTHSPYVLSCMNNEILKQKIDPSESVAAYYLASGKSFDILDSVSGLIDGNELDRISSIISNEFYEMLDSV